MKYIVGRDDFLFKNTAITLGKFDGIHIGHQLLINEIKNDGLLSVVFTFMQSEDSKYIYSESEKRRVLEELGIDVCICFPFDNNTKNISAEQFIKDILIDRLDVKKIVVGSDFRFGKNRIGDGKLLKKLSPIYGYDVHIFDKIKNNSGEEVSSNMIRNLITESKMEKVTESLGRPFSISGVINRGRQLGRTMGFPTINIIPDNLKILPLNGVYASDIVFDDEKGTIYKGITNIGNNPTVADGLGKTIETNIFDFNKDVYGKSAVVYLKKYIRGEKKFSSLDELKHNIEKDKKEAMLLKI